MTELFRCDRCGNVIGYEIELNHLTLNLYQHLCEECWHKIVYKKKLDEPLESK